MYSHDEENFTDVISLARASSIPIHAIGFACPFTCGSEKIENTFRLYLDLLLLLSCLLRDLDSIGGDNGLLLLLLLLTRNSESLLIVPVAAKTFVRPGNEGGSKRGDIW